ncbi:MAG: CYTH domain-containing protein [Victivallaceae bacterium]|nr:CYTH domain-containing protein [Victivallaceae bacterium]
MIECEKKFLIADLDAALCGADAPVSFQQGYFETGPEGPTVRVRLVGIDRACVTFKSRISADSCREYEYEIPRSDGEEMLRVFCAGRIVEKRRSLRSANGTRVWEIDCYDGANSGLATAEIELSGSDEPFERPAWLGEEITGRPEFSNRALALTPWRERSVEA